QNNSVARVGCLSEKRQLVANWVGKHSLENKAFAQLQKLTSQRVSDAGCFVGSEIQLFRQDVGIDKPNSRRLEVGVIERGFASSIRPGKGDNDRSPVERESHLRPALVFTVPIGVPLMTGFCFTVALTAFVCFTARSR